jgi:hypothetical protein
MNPVDYLSSIKNLLLNSPLITSHQITREYEGLQKSYIRARLILSDGSLLEFAEYIEADGENNIKITDYSFQWMDTDGNQIRRWDNTPHFPKLKNFPHHVHFKEDDVISGKPIDIFGVLDEIGKALK